jgi:alkylated DNA repair dioxygenase AlkB
MCPNHSFEASRTVNCRRCSGKYRIRLIALSRTLEKRSRIYGGTADLFGEPELPDGFHYRPNVLSPAEENAFVRQFEKLPLKPFEFHGYRGNRRIYSFGHRYIFAGQEPRADPSIPDYLRLLTGIANQISRMPAEAFEQRMVTEYAPGAGIGWHRDRPTFDTIVGISFLAPCTLRLHRKQGPIGSGASLASNHARCICLWARCATAGSTASLPWTCCAIP